ncbi:MAG TPA: M23 family metallopeptidase [Candidatus Limnocylindrales bacterium]|nr:M23 family metallopeptidase [Candidatus Limnocylindrales bacterium]
MKKSLPRLAAAIPPLLVLLLALPATSAARPNPAPSLWLPAALPTALASSLNSLDLLDGPYAWPVAGPIVRPFDPPPRPWLPGHRGVDIEAPAGSLVRAAAGGVVWFAGMVASRPLVSISHPNGTRTTYEPVKPLVSAGDIVAAGDVIGTLSTGHAGCGKPCLHWGLRQGETYLDPLSLLGLARVRLLPPSSSARTP